MEKSQNKLNSIPFSRMDAAKPPLWPNSQLQTNNVTFQGAIDYPTKFDEAEETQANLDHNFDPNMDPKKLRRKLANRTSNYRARMRKAKYLADLELKAKALQNEIAFLHQNIASYQNVRQSLLVENQTLATQVAILQRETPLKEAELDELKVEVQKLRELYDKQQEQLNWNRRVQNMSNNPFSNFNSDPYDQTPTPSQMWIPEAHDEYKIDLAMLTNMGSLENINLPCQDALNPDFDEYFP